MPNPKMNWKEKTCEKCEYRCEKECRRFPAIVKVARPNSFNESIIMYSSACAEYKELYER